MNDVVIHPRVIERHPELSEDDVREAWNGYVRMTRREGLDDCYVAIGFDSSGRAIEMVAVETIEGAWYVYHAMTPPTSKLLRELGLMG